MMKLGYKMIIGIKIASFMRNKMLQTITLVRIGIVLDCEYIR